MWDKQQFNFKQLSHDNTSDVRSGNTTTSVTEENRMCGGTDAGRLIVLVIGRYSSNQLSAFNWLRL